MQYITIDWTSSTNTTIDELRFAQQTTQTYTGKATLLQTSFLRNMIQNPRKDKNEEQSQRHPEHKYDSR